MDVSCENCGAHYELEPDRFKGSSLRVQCSSCGHVFRVKKPDASASSSPSAPTSQVPARHPDNKWFIRYHDGALSIVPDRASLQRWIVERRIGPEDEVSQDEQSWQKLGEIEEFQPFFLVVAQSTANHVAVTQTGVFAAPVLTPQPQPAVSPAAGVQALSPQQAVSSPSANAEQALPAAPAPSSLGPAQINLQDSSPKATLEFGMSQVMKELESKDPALAAATAAALEDGEHTVAAVEAVPETDAEEAQERTEVSLQGIDDSESRDAVEMRSTDLDQEDETSLSISNGSSASIHEPARPATGEWFMQGDSGVALDEPSFQTRQGSDETDVRDFNAYGSGDGLGMIEEDELAFKPKRLGWGGRIVLLLLVLGVGFGGLYALQPPWADPLLIAMGMRESTQAAAKTLEQLYPQQLQMTEEAWKEVQQQLKALQKAEGNFLGLEVERMRQILMKMEANQLGQDLSSWQQKRARKEIDLARRMMGQIKPKDPKKAAKEATLKAHKTRYASALEAAQQQQQRLRREMVALARQAGKQLQKLQGADRFDLRVRLQQAHFAALSPGEQKIAQSRLSRLARRSLTAHQEQQRKLLLAAFQLHNKQYAQVSDTLDDIRRKHPDWVFPILLRAALWTHQRDFKQAAEELQKALQIAPQQDLATRWRTWLQNPPPSLQSLVAPPARRTKNSKDPKNPKAPKARKASLLTKLPFSTLYRRAEALRRRERFRSAARFYFAALKKRRTSGVYSGLGWCMLDRNRLRSAQKYFKRALKKGPNNAGALFGLGLTYRRKGKKALAKQTLQVFIKRFPNNTYAREVRLILNSLK